LVTGWFVDKLEKEAIVKLFSMVMVLIKSLALIYTSRELHLNNNLSMNQEDY